MVVRFNKTHVASRRSANLLVGSNTRAVDSVSVPMEPAKPSSTSSSLWWLVQFCMPLPDLKLPSIPRKSSSPLTCKSCANRWVSGPVCRSAPTHLQSNSSQLVNDFGYHDSCNQQRSRHQYHLVCAAYRSHQYPAEIKRVFRYKITMSVIIVWLTSAFALPERAVKQQVSHFNAMSASSKTSSSRTLYL